MPDDFVGIDDISGLDDEFNVVERLDIRHEAETKERRNRVESLLRARKYAFVRVFIEGNSTAEDREIVMNDLANFCRKKRSTAAPDPRDSAKLDGRRDVILRIDEYLELSIDALVELKVPNIGGSSS